MRYRYQLLEPTSLPASIVRLFPLNFIANTQSKSPRTTQPLCILVVTFHPGVIASKAPRRKDDPLEFLCVLVLGSHWSSHHEGTKRIPSNPFVS
jgi:hypothetical protein